MTIDWWTLAIQTVNVVILVWLLKRFFWKPVAAIIEQRRATTERTLADAEAKRAQATASLAEAAHTRAGFGHERSAILAEAHKTADGERKTLLGVAAEELAARQAAATALLEKEKAEADAAWADRSTRLAVDIAERLAARLKGAAVDAAFLDHLLKEVRALPEAERQRATANGELLEATSATVLDTAVQERTRMLIGEAFGTHPRITFKADAALIAGLELQGTHFSVTNSWRADLADILADLTHDNRR